MDNEYREQPATPFLREKESGRFLFPAYEQPLAEFVVIPAEWTHVCSARFGPGRPSSFSKTILWTGDSYRYDIFVPFKESEDKRIALRWWNGSGEGWMIAEDRERRDELSILRMIAEMPDERRRWDACHQLWQAAHRSEMAGARSEAVRYSTAFVEGRLKKRRRAGRVRVEILPKVVEETSTARKGG